MKPLEKITIITPETGDLFERPEELPQEVQDVINSFAQADTTYETCDNLIEALNKVGYTCEYGLDAVPYDLMKL